MNKTTHWILILIVIAGAAVLTFLPRSQTPQHPATIFHEPNPPPAPEENEPLTRFPVPPPTAQTTAHESQAPLPALNDSDQDLFDALSQLIDSNRLSETLVFKNLIRRLAVTLDNLPRSKLPLRNLPTQAPPGKFLVTNQSIGKARIDPANDRRYEPYVHLVESLDMQRLATLYFHFYPLFQEAYADLGYKNAYFNDRLIAVVDNLLAAPNIKGPIELVQPSVFYKYADPKLEALSAGQKLMIRIGATNAAKIKAKLRELRQALTTTTNIK